jgi:hypothetical protein
LDGNGDFYEKNNYQKILDAKRNNDDKIDNMEGNLKGKYVIYLLVGYFELLDNIKIIFRNLPQPSYEKYTNLDEVVRNMNDYKCLMGKQWKHMC